MMIAEMLLVGVLGASAGGIGYLFLHSSRERKAREAEWKERESSFRVALVRELRMAKARSFRLSEFAARCEIPADLAERVAEEIFAQFCRQAFADGVITPQESSQLARLAESLEIDSNRRGQIEEQARNDVYKQAVDGVLADGEVTQEEAAELKALRKSLGINGQDAFRLTETLSRDAYLASFRSIAQDGVVTPEEQAELARCKEALALSDAEANGIIRAEALKLYRQVFTGVVQDGEVTKEEERTLRWLQDWTGLSDADLEDYHNRLAEVKRLSAYRNGELPRCDTKKLLEGGETCHWEGSCGYLYKTAKSEGYAEGELVVTSKRIIFASPNKSFSFTPSKILDLDRRSNGISIQVRVGQGSGDYLVPSADELEAILYGLARKHKFLLSENYSSAKTRHIPDDVRREVWDRDGGRCVRCGAIDYLEFDHIIPHSRGGANTVNNVQLLCRKCNNLKSDRI